MIASFHDLATVELNEAAQYYERDSPGLGAAFVTEVERCTAVILEHPEASLIVTGAIRRRLPQNLGIRGWSPQDAGGVGRSHQGSYVRSAPSSLTLETLIWTRVTSSIFAMRPRPSCLRELKWFPARVAGRCRCLARNT